MQIFKGILSFKPHTLQKQTTYLLSVGFFQSTWELTHPRYLEPTRQQLFVCCCNVCGLKKRNALKIRILPRFVCLKGLLFNCLCVFNLFQKAGSQLCFRFFLSFLSFFFYDLGGFRCNLICKRSQSNGIKVCLGTNAIASRVTFG